MLGSVNGTPQRSLPKGASPKEPPQRSLPKEASPKEPPERAEGPPTALTPGRCTHSTAAGRHRGGRHYGRQGADHLRRVCHGVEGRRWIRCHRARPGPHARSALMQPLPPSTLPASPSSRPHSALSHSPPLPSRAQGLKGLYNFLDTDVEGSVKPAMVEASTEATAA